MKSSVYWLPLIRTSLFTGLAILLVSAFGLGKSNEDPATSTSGRLLYFSPPIGATLTSIADSPFINAITIFRGPAGSSMELTGTNLGTNGTVSIGGLSASVVSGGWSATRIICTLPSGQITNLPVIVTRSDGQVSNSIQVSYNPPQIVSVTPASGPAKGGTSVTLTGSNFGSGYANVTMGGQAAPISSQTPNQLVVTSPVGPVGAQAIQVTVDGQISNGVSFTYVADSPTLTAINPTHGSTSGGTSLTLTGTNLSNGGIVTIGGTVAPITASYSDTAVIVNLPTGQGLNQEVTFVVTGQQANSLLFNYDAPVIASITPNHGSTSGGTSLTLTGTNFGTRGVVSIGGVSAPVTAYSHTLVVVSVPAGQGTNLPVVVTVSGQLSTSSVAFSYDAPSITSIAPASGPTSGGSVISLTGTNFGSSGVVTVGGVLATVVSGRWTHTQIDCILPAGQGLNLPVIVTVSGQVSNSLPFSYDAPLLTSISPTHGSAGTTVALTGTSLGTRGTLTIGGLSATVVSGHWTHTRVEFMVPPGQGTNLPVVITRADGQLSNSLTFSYDAPSITSISPASGPAQGGTSIILTGINLGVTSASVSIGGQAAQVTQQTPTSLRVITPAGVAGVQLVVVSVGGQTSNSISFTYVAVAPTLTSINPAHGSTSGGTSLTLTGTNLSSTGVVSIGGTRAPITGSSSDTSVVVSLPAGQGVNLPVVFISGAQSSTNSLLFSYDAPVIASIMPNHGSTSGGTSLTLTGANFGTNGVVSIGGVSAPVTAYSQTLVVVSLPAGQGTNLPVIVTVSGQVSTSSVAFSYDAPSITSISPASGPTSGGSVISLTGTNFGSSGVVTVGGVSATVVSGRWTHTQIDCILPAGQGLNQEVVVTVAGQTSNSLLFNYKAPTLISITPNHGATSGGTSLTLTGTDFGTSGVVSIGGVSAPITGIYSHTSVVVNLPAGEGTNLPVVITVAGQLSNSLLFSYDGPSITSISPASGPAKGGTSVILTGINFGTTSASVTIGGQPALISSQSPTQLVVTSPAGQAGSQPVVVTVGGQTSNSISFTYVALAPTLTSINPAHGSTSGGTSLTLTGTNLTNGGVVTIGGTVAPITGSFSDTAVVVSLPAGQGLNQEITFAIAGQQANSLLFSYDAPAIGSITPNHGSTSGGTSLTLTGINFGTRGVVTIEGVNAPVTIYSQTLVVVSVPAGQGTNLPVVVTVASQASTSSVVFSYDAPLIYSIAPASGPTSGGSVISLTGQSFGTSGVVTIGGVRASLTGAGWSHSRIECLLPSGQGVNLPVVVTRADGQVSNSLAFTYDAPLIASITPASGSTTGGTSLTLTGVNFGLNSANVTMGGQPAVISQQTHTQLVVTSPSGSAGPQAVVVTLNGQVSNSVNFTYVAPAGTALVKVQSLDGDNGQTTNNSINPTLQLVNAGTAAVPYAELTVRYWFTAENFAGINAFIDYAQLGTNKVKMTYVRTAKAYQGADGYVEYSFDASAGNLGANAKSGPIQSRLANQNWATFNETDDYSYRSGTAYADNDHITVYRTIAGGQPQLIWGTEPAVVASVMKFTVLSENKNTNTASNQISTYLKINNVGNVPVNYSDLTMRYWFTADGNASVNYWIDYAEMGAANLGGQFKSVTPVLIGADTYLEFSFKPSAGVFAALGSTGSIQFRAAKADWSAFTETNDYSFKASAPFAENNHITLYYKGQLVYGTEPVSSARLMAPSTENSGPLQIRLLGNPAEGNQAVVEIRNALNQRVELILTDLQGHEINRQTVYQDAEVKQQRVALDGTSPGLYLLTAKTPFESMTTKLTRQ